MIKFNTRKEYYKLSIGTNVRGFPIYGPIVNAILHKLDLHLDACGFWPRTTKMDKFRR